MHCTGYSVIQGTDISSFDVEILDVIAGDPADRSPRILIRASGPAVDATGLGPGFSGSPIYCDDDQGVARNAGAVSEGVGQYGNDVALATPIESILGEPVQTPASARSAPGLLRTARRFSVPLSFTGLAPAVAAVVQRAAAGAHRTVLTVPSAPLAAFPPQELRPGSAVAVGESSGDVASGAIGTVAYVDGDRVWAFGHPLDSVGPRSLFLQDAYVYAVIDNPVAVGDTTTYKLAAPGHDLGTLLNDGISGVFGRTGPLPARFPLHIVAQDRDTGAIQVTDVSVADENAVGLPTGVSPLATVGPIAVAQAGYTILGSAPFRESGSMCARFTVAGRSKPLRFCNTYVGGVGGAEGIGYAPAVTDFATAVSDLDAYEAGPLRITGVQADIKQRRGLAQAFMVGARAPKAVRRGRTVSVRVRIVKVGGERGTRTIRVRVPRDLRPGPRMLTLTGTPADAVTPASDQDLSIVLGLDSSSTAGGDATGPTSLAGLAREIAHIHRYDGVTARFGRTGGRRVYRDPELRLSGTVRVPLVVGR